jgi:hypothetical protein
MIHGHRNFQQPLKFIMPAEATRRIMSSIEVYPQFLSEMQFSIVLLAAAEDCQTNGPR